MNSYDDPAFKVSDLDIKLKQVDKIFSKVNGTPKPREKKIKMDNVKFEGNTIDGEDADWSDFIKVEGGESENSDKKENKSEEKSAEE